MRGRRTARTARTALTVAVALSIGCTLAFPVDDRFKSASTPASLVDAGNATTTDSAVAADASATIPPFDCDGATLCRNFDGVGESADAGWTYSFVAVGNAFDTADDFFLSPGHSARAIAKPGARSAFVGQWLPTSSRRTQLRLAFSLRANALKEVRPFTMALSAANNQVLAPYSQIWPKLAPISGKLVLDVTEKHLDVEGGTIQYQPHPITNRLVDVGEWIALDVLVTATEMTVSINGAQVLREPMALPWVSGYPLVELGAIYYDDADISIDDVRAFLP